jgi:mannosyltransferase
VVIVEHTLVSPPPSHADLATASAWRRRSAAFGDRRDRLMVLGLMTLTGLLGGFRLGAPSLWLDEAWSVAIVDPAAGGGGYELLTDPDLSGMLYYLVLRPWVSIAGLAEWALRLPSLVFAVAAVPLVFLVARELLDARSARVALVVFATSGMLFEWARNVRCYTLALLLVIAATYLFLRAARSGDRRWWVAWVLIGALSIYAHLFSAIVIGSQFLTLPFLSRASTDRRRGVLAAGSMGVLILPLAFFVLAGGDGQVWWIPDLHPRVFLWLATMFAGVGTSLLAVPALLLVVAGAVTLGRWIRRHGLSDPAGGNALFLLVWLLLPFAVVAGISVVRPLFVPRYFIGVLPAFALVLAVGITRLRRPSLMVAALSVVIVATLPLLVSRYAVTGHEDWRGVSDLIEPRWRSGDVIVIDPDLYLIPLDVYLAQWGDPGMLPVPVQGLQPGDFDAGYQGRPASVDFERSLDVRDASRVWLVVREPSEAITSVRSPAGLVPPPGTEDWEPQLTWISEKTSVALLERPGGDGP